MPEAAQDPADAAWGARSRAAVWHPCTQMKRHEREPLLPVVRAQGPWLIDPAGGRTFDAISSWWVNLFGHGHPRIKAALADQFDRVDHVMLAGLTHAPVIELSERLGALTGLGHAFYGSDGASATEIALKMSAHYWRNAGRPQKCRFVGVAGGYHGETVGALSVTDIPLFREAYAPLLRLSATVPSPDARAAAPGEDAAAVAERAAAAAEAWLAAHHAETAALIFEPRVQCAAGMAMHDARYLQRLREMCTRFEVHLIADEIAVGFGRTGTLFAHQQAGIRPDFICLSKGLTGGVLPLSAVLCTDAVYEAFYDDSVARGFLHSHSYTGNALACRAALEVLNIFEDEDVLARNALRAQWLGRALAPLAAHPRVRHVRQAGLIWAADVLGDDAAALGARLQRAALRQGLLLRPIAGRVPEGPCSTLYLMPPYVLDEALCAWLAERCQVALDEALDDALNEALGAEAAAACPQPGTGGLP